MEIYYEIVSMSDPSKVERGNSAAKQGGTLLVSNNKSILSDYIKVYCVFILFDVFCSLILSDTLGRG